MPAAAPAASSSPANGCCWSFNEETKRYQYYPRPKNTACVAPYKPAACPGTALPPPPMAASSPPPMAVQSISSSPPPRPPPPPPPPPTIVEEIVSRAPEKAEIKPAFAAAAVRKNRGGGKPAVVTTVGSVAPESAAPVTENRGGGKPTVVATVESVAPESAAPIKASSPVKDSFAPPKKIESGGSGESVMTWVLLLGSAIAAYIFRRRIAAAVVCNMAIAHGRTQHLHPKWPCL